MNLSNKYIGASLRKQLSAKSHYIFLQKAGSQMFDKVLNTPLNRGKSTILQITVQELVTTSMHNYFKKEAKSESDATIQITSTQINLTGTKETEIRNEMHKLDRKQQLSAT